MCRTSQNQPKHNHHSTNQLWRNESCVYLHSVEEKVDDLNVIDEKLDVEKINDDVDKGMIIDDKNDDTNDMENEIDVGCAQKCSKCEIEEAKNKCEQCEKYFFSTCEIKVLGESVLEFYSLSPTPCQFN